LLRFRSYAHEHREKFDLDVEDFVDQLAVDMGTSRGKSGDIVRLVASRWYDDGVVEGKGKKLQIAMDLALQELQKLSVETNTSESERSHVQELLDRCFQDQDVAQFLDRMPRRDSTANPLPYSDWILEMLLDSARRFQSIEGQIILAQMCFELERDHLVSRALEWLTVKQWMPRFRRSVCNVTQCFRTPIDASESQAIDSFRPRRNLQRSTWIVSGFASAIGPASVGSGLENACQATLITSQISLIDGSRQ
jgi:hypothetical protein